VSLFDQAADDLDAILGDTAAGFARTFVVTSPDGGSVELAGFYQDVHVRIDPATGLEVTGRKVSVTFPLRAFAANGLQVPRGEPRKNMKPWVVCFTDKQGIARTYKVAESMPDELGSLVCQLEEFTQ